MIGGNADASDLLWRTRCTVLVGDDGSTGSTAG
jgi:hypothetical protein